MGRELSKDKSLWDLCNFGPICCLVSLEYFEYTELLFKRGCCIEDEFCVVKYGMVWCTLERDGWNKLSGYCEAGYTERVLNIGALDIALVDVK